MRLLRLHCWMITCKTTYIKFIGFLSKFLPQKFYVSNENHTLVRALLNSQKGDRLKILFVVKVMDEYFVVGSLFFIFDCHYSGNMLFSVKTDRPESRAKQTTASVPSVSEKHKGTKLKLLTFSLTVTEALNWIGFKFLHRFEKKKIDPGQESD